MKRILCAVVLMLGIVLPTQAATLDSVFITFDRNEGMVAFDRIIQEQGASIQMLVNGQLQDSSLFISIESNADGVRYRTDHVKKNVVMAKERGVTAATLLKHFNADMGRVYTVATNAEADTGSVQRYVLLRLLAVGSPEAKSMGVPILAPTVQAPRVVESMVYTTQFLSQVWIGAGAVYTDGKIRPLVYGLWGNERWRFFCEASHSLYHQNRTYAGEELDVTYRYVMVGIAWRAVQYSQFDIVAGLRRSEVYATDFGKYAEKLEGFTLGARVEMRKNLALAGLWTPCEVNTRGKEKVGYDYGRFMISLSVFTSVLGGNEE